MSAFEKLCNEYRENKRLIEELEAMNDSIKTDILAIMGDRETGHRGSEQSDIQGSYFVPVRFFRLP